MDIEELLKNIDETEVYSGRDSDLPTGACCVGGVLCNQLREFYDKYYKTRFPNFRDLAQALRIVNKNLNEYQSKTMAQQIVAENDKRNFTEAKAEMRRALTWKP